ncbi:MAG: hypothetical protein LIO86_09980 [Lachnospiraceae bacterium]|nr:hypothetical protein [Lachnospiraceae bacterium]
MDVREQKMLFMKDSYSARVADSQEFMELLTKMEETGTWIRDVPLDKLYVRPVSKEPEEVAEDYHMEPETVADTSRNSGLFLVLRGGEAYCLRSQGIRSLHERAGISGAAYAKLPKETEARHLNDGLKAMGGTGILRIIGDKCLGIHSSSYNPFSMSEAYGEAMDFFAKEFPEAKMLRAQIRYEGVQVWFDFSAYNEELFSDLQYALGTRRIRPTLLLGMGDAALSSISLCPQCESDGLRIPLGGKIELRHRGKEDLMPRFKRQLSLIEGQFERPARQMARMKNGNLVYPCDTFLNVAAECGLLKSFAKATNQACEMFEMLTALPYRREGREVTPLDVYLGLCRIISFVGDRKETGEKAALKASQMVERALGNFNWASFDYPRMGGKRT